ncbi:predicted protein [Nematostella vectensis]|uniref:G-protein coupled receptors family 1 profile domain-containing protein n=1 Tax=Nematostella vectensis TaxID=45351 RepID=A7SHV9_NEMVE|nr:predicted protein [Nematostella vectensis]|eukprot:XP_001628785.1 predicted protein [Nematostella vectensis]
MQAVSPDNSSALPTTQAPFFPPDTPLYYWVLSGLTCVITLICNLLVIIIICRRRRLYKNRSNWLLLSLATADLTVGLIMIPSIFICFFCPWLRCHSDWTVNKIIYDLLLHISVTNLCIITLDRYTYVICPLRYSDHMSKRVINRLIVTSWCGPLLFHIIPIVIEYGLTGKRRVKAHKISLGLQISIFEILPCLLMLIAYAHIFHIACRHSRNIGEFYPKLSSVNNANNNYKARTRHVGSTVKVFCVVIPLFVVCWGIAAYREVCGAFVSCSVPEHVVYISRLLLKGHSMTDPIVYALQKKDFRKEIDRILAGRSSLRTPGSVASLTQDGQCTPRLRRFHFAKSSRDSCGDLRTSDKRKVDKRL